MILEISKNTVEFIINVFDGIECCNGNFELFKVRQVEPVCSILVRNAQPLLEGKNIGMEGKKFLFTEGLTTSLSV